MKSGYYTHHITCELCGNKVTRETKQKTPQRFCSNKCVNLSMKATEQELWKRAIKAYEKDVIKQEGCWDWKGLLYKKGYACISGSCTHKTRSAHRISWMIHKGPIPDGMHVLHNCDNRKCTNPEHLFLGTNLDNSNDCTKKFRQHSVLKKNQVIEVKKLLKEGNLSHREIGELFGVKREAITKINNGKRWKNISPLPVVVASLNIHCLKAL